MVFKVPFRLRRHWLQRANNDLRCLMAVSRARRRAKASEAPRAREPSETRRRCSNGVLDADAHQAGSVDCDHSIVHGKHICTSYRSNLSRAAPGHTGMTWYLLWRTCTYPTAQRAACAHPFVRRVLSVISLNGFSRRTLNRRVIIINKYCQ